MLNSICQFIDAPKEGSLGIFLALLEALFLQVQRDLEIVITKQMKPPLHLKQ